MSSYSKSAHQLIVELGARKSERSKREYSKLDVMNLE